MKISEIEKLIDRQLADTKHSSKGGKFDRFNCRKISRPAKDKLDERGLYKLDWPSKR